jgi:hypothetical protein
MDKFLIFKLLSVACTTAFAGSVSAATLGLTTAPPTITAEEATVSYSESPDGTTGDLTSFLQVVTETAGLSDDLGFLSTTLDFLTADPMGTASGSFIVDDAFLVPFLASFSLTDIGYEEDTIEVVFGDLEGPGADSFGDSVLLTMVFDDQTSLLGTNPFEDLVPGDYMATITVANIVDDTMAIPLPVSMPLLFGAIGGLGLVSRSRT